MSSVLDLTIADRSRSDPVGNGTVQKINFGLVVVGRCENLKENKRKGQKLKRIREGYFKPNPNSNHSVELMSTGVHITKGDNVSLICYQKAIPIWYRNTINLSTVVDFLILLLFLTSFLLDCNSNPKNIALKIQHF